MDANMQVTINSFRQLFPDISLTFSKIPDISLTAVKFPDISRFSRQVVTLYKSCFGVFWGYNHTSCNNNFNRLYAESRNGCIGTTHLFFSFSSICNILFYLLFII